MSRWLNIFRTGRIEPVPPDSGGTGAAGSGPDSAMMPEQSDGADKRTVSTGSAGETSDPETAAVSRPDDAAPSGAGRQPDAGGISGTEWLKGPIGTKRHTIGTAPRIASPDGKISLFNGLAGQVGPIGTNGTNGTGSIGTSGVQGAAPRPGSGPDDPASWRRWYRRHLVLRSCLPRQQAERRAYALAQLTWHRHHGVHADPRLCAGCGAPLAGRDVLRMDGGTAVHFDGAAGLDCLIEFAARWRGAAEQGLRGMGIEPPPGWKN